MTRQNMTRHEQMKKAAQTFHGEHPEVLKLFIKFTFEKIRQGFKHYSASAVFQRIRWETARPEYEPIEFKLNNNHIPFYARSFMGHYPDHKGFFRTRHQISREHSASKYPELTPKDYGADYHA
jgi:hypothetical protein